MKNDVKYGYLFGHLLSIEKQNIMKTIYFLMISAILVSCKGKIPKFGAKPRSNYSNAVPAAGRATQIYNRTVGSDDDDKKVDLDNPYVSPNGSYTSPPQVNYKPSIDLSKIKVEMPKMKTPELKKPNFKLEDYNSKEYRERLVQTMMELEKLKKQ
jgi:hypothetical protein